jgi:hypothetical protein
LRSPAHFISYTINLLHDQLTIKPLHHPREEILIKQDHSNSTLPPLPAINLATMKLLYSLGLTAVATFAVNGVLASLVADSVEVCLDGRFCRSWS